MTFKHGSTRAAFTAAISLLILAGSVAGASAHPRHVRHVLAHHWRFEPQAPLVFEPWTRVYVPDDYSVPMSGDTISGINGI
jgi:hypothetical protein